MKFVEFISILYVMFNIEKKEMLCDILWHNICYNNFTDLVYSSYFRGPLLLSIICWIKLLWCPSLLNYTFIKLNVKKVENENPFLAVLTLRDFHNVLNQSEFPLQMCIAVKQRIVEDSGFYALSAFKLTNRPISLNLSCL